MTAAKSRPPGGEETMLSIDQAAQVAGLSRASLAKLIDSRVLASKKTGDGECLVAQNAILDWHAGERVRQALAIGRLGADLDREIFPQ